MFNKRSMIIGLVVFGMFVCYKAFAIPRYNNDPHSVYHSGNHDFSGDVSMSGDVNFSGGFEIDGLSDVNGDALCIESDGDFGTCGAAVFTTSISSPAHISAATGGSDNITFSPAGVLGMTLAETSNNLTVVGDITASGADINSTNFNGSNLKSPATGGADDISVMPAGVAVLNVNEAGDLLMAKVVTVHGACSASGHVGRIEFYNDGADHISLCFCEQTAAATFAWKAGSATGSC